MCRAIGRSAPGPSRIVLSLVLVVAVSTADAQEGFFQRLRNDVRGVVPPSAPPESPPESPPDDNEDDPQGGRRRRRGRSHHGDRVTYDDGDLTGYLGLVWVGGYLCLAGVIVRRLEVFTGYEYLDIDNSQFSALVGGVRFWF